MLMSLFQPMYFISGLFAFAILFLFPIAKHIEKSERRKYYLLQIITLIGAIAGAKLSVLFGDYNWPFKPVDNWQLIFVSGRSITGALILGFLAAETAKPILRYTLPPNDRFAAILPFSIGIGRIGCFLTGCCGGIPYQGFCAIRNKDGVLSHPSQLYEMVFQFSIGLIFVYCVKRRILFGHLFSIYLMSYGLFRFFTEPLRVTPKYLAGYSGYQVLAALMFFPGAIFFIKRRFFPASTWSNTKPTLTAVLAANNG